MYGWVIHALLGSQISQRLGGDEFQLLAGRQAALLILLFHPRLSSQHSILESFVHLLHSSFLHVALYH